jgi:hypothetical protein
MTTTAASLRVGMSALARQGYCDRTLFGRNL